MSYLVFARKYRPQDFSSVSGQEHVTRTLANAISRDKVSHAYLLAGPRGVGKTSIARIFSKALNCEKGPSAKPCLKCTNCQEIAQGISLAVREIDGASHNSVDNVRELIDSFRSLPAPGSRYKIYIIDEVHMLSTAAFNALLKSLEEPPPHTVFILATTEPHKIPETVISRCQRHDLRAISSADIEQRLKHIAAQEKMDIEPEALRMISRLSEGSMRDAQSILDRVQAFCEGRITAADAGKLLGSVEKAVLFKLSRAVFEHDSAQVLKLLSEAFSVGLDAGLFLKEFTSHWRELLIARFGGEQALAQMGLAADDVVELRRQVASVGPQDVQDLVMLAREGADLALRSAYPKYALEALLVRMALRKEVVELSGLVTGLKELLSLPAAAREVAASAAPKSAPLRVASSPVDLPARAVEKAAANEPVTGIAFDWKDFIRHALDRNERMLAEQLKQLSVSSFVPGSLVAEGPEFCVRYLQEGRNGEKLKKLLESFYQAGTDWRFKFTRVENGGSALPGSVVREEKQVRHARSRENKENIANHPSLKTLQQVFPGSTIEDIEEDDSEED